MNNKDRNSIIKEMTRRIKEDIKDFNDLETGQREVIQDEYIDIISKEMGESLSEFYAADGKKLNRLLTV